MAASATFRTLGKSGGKRKETRYIGRISACHATHGPAGAPERDRRADLVEEALQRSRVWAPCGRPRGRALVIALALAVTSASNMGKANAQQSETSNADSQPDLRAGHTVDTNDDPLRTDDADEEPAETARLTASARGRAVTIDGRLDELDWSQAAVSEDFTERVPHPGDRPPVRTTVRVLYDRDAIYVGVEAFLARGETPRALELARDSLGIFEDDAISIKIDARRDRRTTLGFVVNPANAQLDYIAVDNGESFQTGLDMVWESGTQIRDDRWTAEFRIPVVALGLSDSEEARSIGLNVTRDHNARAATYDWSATPQEFGPFSALHYGIVEGVVVGGGVPAMLTLYSLGEYASLNLDGDSHALRGSAGADAWIRLGADTWLEATLFTDFSQVDLDDALVNLDRFPLFFPERRPFFLNGLDVFASGVSQQLQPFYSRRIGLGERGRQLSVLGGLKVYGREGPVSFGLLDVLTDESGDRPATNDLAARGRISLDGRASFAGVMLTSRTPFRWDGGLAEGAHVTYAADLRTRLADERIDVYAFGAGTARDEGDLRGEGGGEGAAAALTARYRGEVFQPRFSALWVGPGFEPQLGFVRRPEAARAELWLPFVARPSGVVRRITVAPGGEMQTDALFDRLLLLKASIDIELELFDGWILGAGGDYLEDTVRESFEIVPDIFAQAGTYKGARLDAWLESPGQRNPAIELYYGVNNAYFGGELHNGYAKLRILFGPHVRFETSADVYHVTLPGYDPFWTAGVNAGLRITPSTTVQIDLLARLDTETERASTLLRLRWRYAAGSDLFLVWREDSTWIGGQLTSERTVTAKMTLRFDTSL